MEIKTTSTTAQRVTELITETVKQLDSELSELIFRATNARDTLRGGLVPGTSASILSYAPRDVEQTGRALKVLLDLARIELPAAEIQQAYKFDRS